MSAFAPVCPSIRVAPTKVAADTYVVHSVQEALGQPLFVYLNSMVILGAEPLILDTGTIANRQQWLEDVFSLVEPKDVQWVYLSHDDVDHTGNLEQVMDACPNARLICTWAMVERHTNCFEFPIDRCNWVADGESIDLGDRTVVAMRPPVYDSPATRGLFDSSTGVYWSADAWATPLPDHQAGVADLDPEFWEFGVTLFTYGALSPWLSIVDPAKYGKTVDRIQQLGATTIAGCHTPVLEGAFIDKGFDLLRALPTVDAPPLPDQSVLDQIVAATSVPQA